MNEDIKTEISKQVQSSIGALARLVYEMDSNIKEHIKKSDGIEKTIDEENKQIKKTQENLDTVIFGNKEVGFIGMKEKVDDMHTILTEARATTKVLGGVGDSIKWLLGIVAAIVVLRTFLEGILSFLTTKP